MLFSEASRVGQKILVVEDNELNLKLFCDLLRAHGFEAEPVRDGREAVARARSFMPDLIIMDIQMPWISGLELIEQMKGDEELRRTPIMAVTAYAAKGDEERIRAAGAEGYVSKPISLVRFIEAVRGLLASAEAAAGPADVRVERRIDAPIERVFDAWLDPATMGEWLFRTPEGELVSASAEPEAGGAWEVTERRDGEDGVHRGVYEAIERPTRLVFTLNVPKASADETRVIVAVAAGEDGTTLALTQTMNAGAAENAERIAQGWAKILDALAARLERGES
jgi:two-component system cell cycle response regulator DivK